MVTSRRRAVSPVAASSARAISDHGVGAEVVEHVHRGAKLLAGPDPLPLPPQAGTVGQVRAGGLEGVRRLAVQGQRGFEVRIGLALGGE